MTPQMSSAQWVRNSVLPPALSWLGEKYNSPEAIRFLLAIGFQESGFEYRKQVGGPAHGFWQFEEGGGVLGVMSHGSVQRRAKEALSVACYGEGIEEAYGAIVNNDFVAAVFARLLVYSSPRAVPVEENEAWGYYLDVWRPGKPRPQHWGNSWKEAGELI